MEQKQLNECVRVWAALYKDTHGEAPTKQQVAEVRGLYKALYSNRNDWNTHKSTIRKGYDISRHNSYNPVNSYWSRYKGEDDDRYSDLMPAMRTKKGEIYILSLEPATYKNATNEEGTVRSITQSISVPGDSRFAFIANKWAPEGTRKNHITDALLVRFKPHIVHALRINAPYWALSYNSTGSIPAWIDWSAFVEVAHQEADDEFTTTFNIEIENTKHNTKEIENELKEMMV